MLYKQNDTPTSNDFNYNNLSPKKRKIILQNTGEIKQRLRRTAQDIWEIGQKLFEVRTELEYGQFDTWVKAEFGWSRRTAYNFISVYEAFGKSANFAQLEIATSALYKLAASSTPQSVRKKFLDKAQQGEKITHKEISQALESTKNSQNSEKTPLVPLTSQKILQIVRNRKVVFSNPVAEDKSTSILQKPSQPITAQTQIELKAECWYIFDQINVLFCGDTASKEFRYRSPEGTLALAVTSDDWDHDWLIEKTKNLILLQEDYLSEESIKQAISLFSEKDDTIIFPWLPNENMLKVAHRMQRRIIAGDRDLEKCQKAMLKVGRSFEQLKLS